MIPIKTEIQWQNQMKLLHFLQNSQHKKASNHHANLPLEMYSSARAIIKVSGHQHQWFPGVSQVVTM